MRCDVEAVIGREWLSDLVPIPPMREPGVYLGVVDPGIAVVAGQALRHAGVLDGVGGQQQAGELWLAQRAQQVS